ncbi:MAG TPA: (d)CMP kinase [Geobacteraceae bacterium]|nr:(d)CMP kinase [Geobacteraceae bacterium]
MSGSSERKIIVAIDGPSGAGKSTVTRALADRLGYINIDTGAMFRAVALMVERGGIDPEDEASLATLCAGLEIDFDRTDGCCRVLVNGEDVSAAIRTPEISLLTSVVSTKKVVRDYLLTLQRRMGERGGVVLEGRDIGTVVFPSAQVKFFLTASVEERGRRRFEELNAKGTCVTLEQTILEVEQRDRQDLQREHAPLRRADDAIDIDSTALTLEDVLEKMEAIVREKAAEDLGAGSRG